MYVVLAPFEKLVYLAFWGGCTEGEAGRRISGEKLAVAAFGGAVRKLAGAGLLRKTSGGYAADLSYMVETVERGNHLYPERMLSQREREAFAAILGSKKFSGWVAEDFQKAVELAVADKDVLGGFFWSVFRDVFAYTHAYLLASGELPSVEDIGADFGSFLEKRAGKKKLAALRDELQRGAPDAKAFGRAFSDDFAFLFPRELAEFLRWDIDVSPSVFVLRESMARSLPHG
ncbi:MAG: hypothetical protein AB1529_04605 [Candidatus Micrarchaeota archaeon]